MIWIPCLLSLLLCITYVACQTVHVGYGYPTLTSHVEFDSLGEDQQPIDGSVSHDFDVKVTTDVQNTYGKQAEVILKCWFESSQTKRESKTHKFAVAQGATVNHQHTFTFSNKFGPDKELIIHSTCEIESSFRYGKDKSFRNIDVSLHWRTLEVVGGAHSGGWTAWKDDTTCTATCGWGKKDQSRSCTNPAPSAGGNDCIGDSKRTTTCNTDPCPVNGGWGSWEHSTPCTVTCGSGFRNQARSCDSPAPSNGGLPCDGEDERTVECNIQDCPVDGGWDAWEDSTKCTATCGGGYLAQKRTCTNPEPSNGGLTCVGAEVQTIECNTQECPDNK